MTSPTYIAAAIIFFTGLIIHVLPSWQRRGLFFGISVLQDVKATTGCEQLVRKFRTVNWIVAAVLFLIAATMFPENPNIIGLAALTQSLAAILTILWTRNQAKPWASDASNIHTTSLLAEHAKLPGRWISFVLPLLLFPAVAWYLNANWDDIPQRIPLHYNAVGEANRWGAKSAKSVFSVLFIGFSMQLLLLAVVMGMALGTRRALPNGARMLMIRASLRMMLSIQWITAIMTCAISLQPLHGNSVKPVIFICTALVVISTFGFVIRLGQLQATQSDETDNTPGECWHLAGQIYYNPGDPALMVEKRLGIGYTLNFGNKFAWGIIPLVLLVAFAPVVLFK